MIEPLFHRFIEIGSTNDVAADLARQGAPEGTVITAQLQTKGRGRRGRQWHSYPGESVLMTLLLRPAIPLNRFSELAFVAAVAVCGCLLDCGIRPELKWPNDVLVDGMKISGILIETASDAALVGIGLNVRQTDFSLGLNAQATSIALCGGTCLDVDEVTESILSHLFCIYELPFEEILMRWRKYMWGINCRVEVVTEAGNIVGTISGVADDGALLLDGGRHRIISAEAIHVLRT